MNKEETQKEIQVHERIREITEEKLNTLNLQLRDLREAEKPKLRHGDFGINEAGSSRIALFQNGTTAAGKNLGLRDDYCPTGIVNDSDITIFGNIFDLLKEWSEDFEDWESKPAYENAIQIIIETKFNGIFFGNSGNGATFNLENITEIWRKLGHAIAHLKRKKENK